MESRCLASCGFKVRFPGQRTRDGGNAQQKRLLAEQKAKAESGDPLSQLMYGMLLEFRTDMNVDQDDPLSWFVKAAQERCRLGQYLVGMHMLSRATTGYRAERQQGPLLAAAGG
jgi:TPR repeat protein